MPATDVIVIGGSAGSLVALEHIVRALPRDLPAMVLIALHVSPQSGGGLPSILARVASLPAAHGADGERVRHGRIVVAPPDRHLLVDDGHVRVVHGPRENGFRPAIDPLFRSAADSYGPRVAGVVLSGLLDDGALGLQQVKRAGGITVVQSADDALFDSMPLAAMRRAEIDHVVPAAAMPALLVRLARDHSRRENRAVSKSPRHRAPKIAPAEVPSAYTCPECKGTLWPVRGKSGVDGFRCRVGHRYGIASLDVAKDAEIEAALWTAVRTLEEAADLRRRMARRAADAALAELARGYERRAEDAEAHAASLRPLLTGPSPPARAKPAVRHARTRRPAAR